MDFKEQYFNAWTQAWQLHKKFCNNNGSDQIWEKIINSSSEIVKEYENKPTHDFMKNLVLAVISELERVDTERKENTTYE